MTDQTGENSTGTSPRAAVTLGTVCGSIVLVPIVATGASVALPGISTDLGTGLSSAQWVVNAFFLTFASFMAITGSLADLTGRRRMFSAGLATFCVAMIVAATAPTIAVLVVARVIAGVGAAAVTTGGSAVLAHAFQGRARTRAFAAFGTSIGLGLAFGPLVAGVLVTSLGGWRVFFSAAAVVVLPALAASFTLADSRDSHPAGPDWLGAATFTLGLSLFVLAVIEGPALGWVSPIVITALAASIALFGLFVRCERRVSHPMIDVSLFAQPRFVAICVLPVLLAFGFVALLIVLPPYFMAVDSMSAQSAGLLLVLLTGPTLIIPGIVGAVAHRVPQRLLLVLIVVLIAVGSAWLTVIEPHTSALTLAGPLLTLGSGFGVSLAILDGAAVASVDSSRAGMAAGIFNTMRLGGESVSIAVLGAIVTAVTASRLSGPLGDAQSTSVTGRVLQGDMSGAVGATADPHRIEILTAQAYTSGLHVALWAVTLLSVLGVVVVTALTRRPAPHNAAELADESNSGEPAGIRN